MVNQAGCAYSSYKANVVYIIEFVNILQQPNNIFQEEAAKPVEEKPEVETKKEEESSKPEPVEKSESDTREAPPQQSEQDTTDNLFCKVSIFWFQCHNIKERQVKRACCQEYKLRHSIQLLIPILLAAPRKNQPHEWDKLQDVKTKNYEKAISKARNTHF